MKCPLDPYKIPKFVSKLKKPAVFSPTVVKDTKTGKVVSHNYTVTVTQFKQQILPRKFPKTTVYGYAGLVKSKKTGRLIRKKSTPGSTFEATRGIPANVQWVNDLTEPNIFAVDPTLHWANPNNMKMPHPPFKPYPPGYKLAQSPVPMVTHLHGGELRPDSDGHPTAWFTAGEEKTGEGFTKSRDNYPNTQNPTTLWYHDHVLGTTRLGIYAGLSGFYLIRDPKNKIEPLLPSGDYEIPLVIQDRSFFKDGSFLFPSNGQNPDVHPYWRSAFIGNTIMVNGKVWPRLDVERRQYRFRILNGSNTRTYNLKLSNNQSFIQIGSDGGFLPYPVELNEVLVSPAERVDILIDFSKLDPCTEIIMTNDANAPFPNGNAPDPDTVGQIMQFKVLDTPVTPPADLPKKLNKIPTLIPDVPKRTLTLNVVRDGGPPSLELLLNGQKWGSPITELPIVGSTEEWEIVNLTGGAHPIHVHLIQFQVKNTQSFNAANYRTDWEALNGQPPLQHPTITLPVKPYVTASPEKPPENEQGWKDTIFAMPGKVTRILLRFAPQDAKTCETKPGVNLFPFDPTIEPGYVWHCHLVDHEDNEMMRPLKVINYGPEPNPQTCCKVLVNGSTQLLPPAFVNDPITCDNELFANIEAVCPEQVIISGFIRRTITYTGILDDGSKENNTIVDDIPFQCKIDRDDANEADSFNITGKSILCKVSSNLTNTKKNCMTHDEVAYKYEESDLVKICVRKDC